MDFEQSLEKPGTNDKRDTGTEVERRVCTNMSLDKNKLTGRTQGIVVARSKEENEYSEEGRAKLFARSRSEGLGTSPSFLL